MNMKLYITEDGELFQWNGEMTAYDKMATDDGLMDIVRFEDGRFQQYCEGVWHDVKAWTPSQ